MSPRADGYANATELTAAHPRASRRSRSASASIREMHPESPSVDHDIDVLKAKVDAGATRAISQFFFDIDAFLRFHRQGARGRDHHPDRAGDHAGDQLQGPEADGRACAAPRCPDWLGNLFEGLDDDPDTRRLIAGSVAAEMCARLEEEGFADFHFYTLNRADLVYAICRVLGVREPAKEAAQ